MVFPVFQHVILGSFFQITFQMKQFWADRQQKMKEWKAKLMKKMPKHQMSKDEDETHRHPK